MSRGSTAISGIVYYAADAFPREHHGTIYIGDVMTNEIVQFQLTWNGSSPKAKPTTFLDSKDRWFRPVDIKLGPDGSVCINLYDLPIMGPDDKPINPAAPPEFQSCACLTSFASRFHSLWKRASICLKLSTLILVTLPL